MLDEAQTREEWSARFHSLLADELHRGARRGLLTVAEAEQLAARFLVLLDQALDLPSVRRYAPGRDPADATAT
ncbi:hypothetical protein [Pseudonocardia acaciae]|uniref:hypothetical protein n=1 Tax=Pseudonocardia acaciae TaxID=551276 RepID=UPI00048E4E53|nr:hypothetical protein [Pseudonocardia acaciae]